MKLIYPISLAIAVVACQAPPQEPDVPAARTEARATLGVTTAIPAKELADGMALEFQVRQQGRVVESVAEESAASNAGIRAGDVLLQLGDVTLYSQDDIDDFVSIHEPGEDVRVTLVRSGTREREELLVSLGKGSARAMGGIRWQFASLAQLPAALDRARAEKKKVLVGLSGAET